jgi:hypothetical protein
MANAINQPRYQTISRQSRNSFQQPSQQIEPKFDIPRTKLLQAIIRIDCETTQSGHKPRAFDTSLPKTIYKLQFRASTPFLITNKLSKLRLAMANNPLSTESILKHMADALPTHVKGDTNSVFSSSYEAIALFAHACMTAVGFRLIGYSEGQKTGKLFPFVSVVSTNSPETELAEIAPRLSTKWNSSYGSYSFLYAHSQSSMQYVIKIGRLGGKAEIRGIGLGDERISRFEVTAKDYISNAALPLRINLTADGEEDRSDLDAKLKEVFISPSRIQG